MANLWPPCSRRRLTTRLVARFSFLPPSLLTPLCLIAFSFGSSLLYLCSPLALRTIGILLGQGFLIFFLVSFSHRLFDYTPASRLLDEKRLYIIEATFKFFVFALFNDNTTLSDRSQHQHTHIHTHTHAWSLCQRFFCCFSVSAQFSYIGYRLDFIGLARGFLSFFAVRRSWRLIASSDDRKRERKSSLLLFEIGGRKGDKRTQPPHSSRLITTRKGHNARSVATPEQTVLSVCRHRISQDCHTTNTVDFRRRLTTITFTTKKTFPLSNYQSEEEVVRGKEGRKRKSTLTHFEMT